MATTCCAKPANLPRISALAAGGGNRVPRTPTAASGSSGRRFCRIYREGDRWILHLQPGAWPSNSADEDCRVPFHSLSEAIGYAVGNELSYRVIHDGEPRAARDPAMLDLSQRKLRAVAGTGVPPSAFASHGR